MKGLVLGVGIMMTALGGLFFYNKNQENKKVKPERKKVIDILKTLQK